ncbi:ABC transporter permease [Shigella flexneri]
MPVTPWWRWGCVTTILGQRVISEQQQIKEAESWCNAEQASAILIRDSARAALIPTVDSAKTVGLVG